MIRTPARRRQFLQSLGAAAVVGAAGPLFFRDASARDSTKNESLPIIDTHQHLWDMTRFKLPWHKGEDTKPLQRSFVMSDYLEATKGLNVVKTVYMEVDVAPEQQVDEAEYVIDLCQRGDNPLKASFSQWLNALQHIVKDRPLAFQQKLFHDNAAKFYGI